MEGESGNGSNSKGTRVLAVGILLAAKDPMDPSGEDITFVDDNPPQQQQRSQQQQQQQHGSGNSSTMGAATAAPWERQQQQDGSGNSSNIDDNDDTKIINKNFLSGTRDTYDHSQNIPVVANKIKNMSPSFVGNKIKNNEAARRTETSASTARTEPQQQQDRSGNSSGIDDNDDANIINKDFLNDSQNTVNNSQIIPVVVSQIDNLSPVYRTD